MPRKPTLTVDTTGLTDGDGTQPSGKAFQRSTDRDYVAAVLVYSSGDSYWAKREGRDHWGVASYHGTQALAAKQVATLIKRGYKAADVAICPVAPKAEMLTTANNRASDGGRKEGTMPRKTTKAAKAAATTTNSRARKDAAHKAGKCQLCGEKTTGFSVVLVDGVVKRVKAKAGHAFYCKDHADRKVKIRQSRYDSRAAKPASRKAAAAAKPAARKAKAAAKAATKAAPKRARKRTAAAASAEPF